MQSCWTGACAAVEKTITPEWGKLITALFYFPHSRINPLKPDGACERHVPGEEGGEKKVYHPLCEVQMQCGLLILFSNWVPKAQGNKWLSLKHCRATESFDERWKL